MTKSNFAVVAGLLVLGLCKQAHANSPAAFTYDVSTGVADALTYNKNAQSFRDQKIPLMMWTDVPLTIKNISTVSAQGIARAMYKKGPKLTVDMTLRANMRAGQVQMAVSLTQMDYLIDEWKKLYAPPLAFKDLSPLFDKLEFREGEGFKFQCALIKRFEYIALVEIPCSEQLVLTDVTPVLEELRNFIRFLEADKRSVVMLRNNRSGRPTILTYQIHPEGGYRFVAHHPLHDIQWDQKSREKLYKYTDGYSEVRELPEVKRAASTKEVRQLLKSEGDQVRVTASGSDKGAFQVTFTGTKSQQQVVVSLDGKKILN